jgi:L-asparaginase II
MDRWNAAGDSMSDPVLVEVTREPRVESRHRGAIAVVDSKGKVRAAIGDIHQPVFPRSAVKALQALPLVESGAADRYGFGAAELALACASHGGERRHVETAAEMLTACGCNAADLECGTHLPIDRTSAEALIRAGVLPSALHNNCSGKHAGFVSVACHLGVPVEGYVGAGHPVQREVTAVLESMTGISLGPESRGIDGCSIPAYAIPLDRLAQAFARLVTGERLTPLRATAARRLVDACNAEPFMVAGTGRFDTEAMALFGPRLFVKGGAEGAYCAAFPELGLGVAVKCDDGAGRAAEVAVAAVVEAYLRPSEDENLRFADRVVAPVFSRAGKEVGEIRPVAGLIDALREGGAVN